ncbi:MAG TPA: hypothetical protein VKZ52_01345 [Burkholderiaceae bacterium]|nr:hypothetical protein [Burkholderiaceae bacterium]
MVTCTGQLLQYKGRSLVVGMEWFPLLGDHPERQARALARRRGAAHWACTAGAAASAGVLATRLRQGRGRQVGSAAAAFANVHPVGTVAAVVPLPGERIWLVAVHEGAVMARTDQLHEDPAAVHERLETLWQAHPGMVLLDERRDPSGLLEALFQLDDAGVALRHRRGSTSRGLLLTTVLLSLSAGLGRVLLAGEPPRPHVTDPVAAWQAATSAATRGVPVQGAGGLKSLLDGLMAQPVQLAGWSLGKVECEPGAVRWRCRSTWRREKGGDNRSLEAAAPADWALSFDPLDGATATWEAPMPAVPLNVVTLRRATHNQTQLVSALQAMRPAFLQLKIEAPRPLPVTAPLDADQRPIARPRGVDVIQQRAVRLRAPLRSLTLLLPETRHMSWERVVMAVDRIDHPTLLNSALTLSMSGVLYELEDDVPPSPAAADGASRSGPGRGAGR